MGWNSNDWKGLAASLGKVAPVLGTILGGPVGWGWAVSVLTGSGDRSNGGANCYDTGSK